MRNYRFIPYEQFDAATNMAIDEYLLESQLAGAPPVLRLYGFAPPAITIGLSQKVSDELVARVKSKGFDIVRRPTGGRAVLHHKDLTYSFVACQTGTGEFGILNHSINIAYKEICLGLQNAFKLLGLNAELGSTEAAYRHLADCFLASTNADLQFDGKKLAGSAQLRRKGAVLQHGSIPLNLEQGLMIELLEGSKKADADIEQRHANLFDSLAREVDMQDLSEAIKKGFELAFEASFEVQSLSSDELNEAKQLGSSRDFYFCGSKNLELGAT